jgi:hypothetical protein
MAHKGIDIRATADRLILRASLKDADGAKVTSGTTSLYLYELQDDGTLKSYDFSDDTFKSTALTTETAAMTHRTGNNGGTNTGIWTYAVTTLDGFTNGSIYIAVVSNSSASPPQQEREFQFGSAEGDLQVDGNGYLQVDLEAANGSTGAADGLAGMGTVYDATGALNANVASMGANTLTASALATDAVTEIVDAVEARFPGSSIEVVSNFDDESEELTVKKTDDYNDNTGQEITFNAVGFETFPADSVYFRASRNGSLIFDPILCTTAVVDATTQSVTLHLTRTELAELRYGALDDYRFRCTYVENTAEAPDDNGEYRTIRHGKINVEQVGV